MIRARRGQVTGVTRLSAGVLETEVVCEGVNSHAICYPDLTGPVAPGDWVILNTNAVQLKLGTGGYHFVMWVEGRESLGGACGPGHIIKARYTPFQVCCLTAEEEGSQYHEALKEPKPIHGIPVVACELHSMVAPVAAGIKEATGNEAKVAYVMTDGGALPAAFSKLARNLRDKALIDSIITCGHAFGGDLESVNVYSALCVAKECTDADAVVVAMGPGQVGTGTKYGFSGIEQGIAINAAHSLGGIPILAPRISFFDLRGRHFGVSHHTITVLAQVVLVDCVVVLPEMLPGRWEFIKSQLSGKNLAKQYVIVTENGMSAVKRLQKDGIDVATMGRTVPEDPEFFLAAGAAGVFAGRLVMERKARV
ncbi:MAG: DUF3866 family protein [Firmicutes bacterium]|jgi:hypothetical protein|nr:DUF3866 family protein [Bacillota bacterium]